MSALRTQLRGSGWPGTALAAAGSDGDQKRDLKPMADGRVLGGVHVGCLRGSGIDRASPLSAAPEH
jgi:hypothetical protein